MFRSMLTPSLFLLAVTTSTVYCQSNSGELRLAVRDPTGRPLEASVNLVSESNQYQVALRADATGAITVQRLPFGTYQLEVTEPGFASLVRAVEIRSFLPMVLPVRFGLATVVQTVRVDAGTTLLDAHQAGAVDQIGTAWIESRLGSVPGRSLQDLVNSQPGWLYEGNACFTHAARSTRRNLWSMVFRSRTIGLRVSGRRVRLTMRSRSASTRPDSGGVWPQAGRRRRAQHRATGATWSAWKGGALGWEFCYGGCLR